MTVKNIYDFLDKFAPYNTQAEYDNSGLNAGDFQTCVRKILVALDITVQVISEAREIGADLIVSHHPVIFGGIKFLQKDSPPYLLAEYGIAALSCHTNFDVAADGSDDVMLERIRRVIPVNGAGVLDKAVAADEFAAALKQAFGGTVRYVPTKNAVQNIAVCAGAGGSRLQGSFKIYRDAPAFDTLVTGEVKHSDFAYACNRGLGLFEVGHFESELPATEKLYDILKDNFKDIQTELSKVRWISNT